VTPDELQAIRERAEAATPGPWVATHRHSQCTADDDETSGLGLEIEGPPEAWNRGQFALGADALFIAHARTDIETLLAEVEQLRAALEELVEAHDAPPWGDGEDPHYEKAVALGRRLDAAWARAREALGRGGE
jgi:hypothetical protein